MDLKILKDNLLQCVEKLGIHQDFRYYQDNEPKHKSAIVKTWLIWNCPQLMEPIIDRKFMGFIREQHR